MKLALALLLLQAVTGTVIMAQSASPLNPQTNLLQATSTTCSVASSCVWMQPPANSATISVVIAGTFSATLIAERSADNGNTWSTVATLTTTGTTSYSIAAFSDFRVRMSAYTSGQASVTLLASLAGGGANLAGAGAPTGTCAAGSLYTNNSGGAVYSCNAGSWALIASGGGGITGLTTGFLPKASSATAIANSLCDEGITTANTLTCTDSAGAAFSGPVSAASDGVHAGELSVIGNTTAPAIPSNTANLLGPNSASFTAYGLQLPSTAPTVGQTMIFGTASGGITPVTYGNSTGNCSSSASPAVCVASSAGSVALPTGTNPTLVVNTTAVTANSQILLNVDEGLGTKLGVTCNSTLSTLLNPVVTARTAGTSFTFTIGATIATNPACVSYMIIN